MPSVSDTGQTDFSGDMIKTFEQLLQTKDLSARVVKSEHLNENPEFLTEDITPPIAEEIATGMLEGDVKISIRLGTRLIDITVEHHSPKMAQLLVNRLAEESISQEFDQNAGSATTLSNYLDKEVGRLQQKVSESESATWRTMRRLIT